MCRREIYFWFQCDHYCPLFYPCADVNQRNQCQSGVKEEYVRRHDIYCPDKDKHPSLDESQYDNGVPEQITKTLVFFTGQASLAELEQKYGKVRWFG